MTARVRRTTLFSFMIIAGVLVIRDARDLSGQTSGSGAPAITETTVWDSVYTLGQVRLGAQSYGQFCGGCHGEKLRGNGAGAPPLVGEPFFDRWSDLSVFDLSFAIRSSMPHRGEGIPLPGTVSFLSPSIIRDIVTFVLQSNGMPAGSQRLERDYDTLRHIRITRKPMTR